MTTPAPTPPIDTEALATRVVYELLGRRWVWPPIQAVDAYPMTMTVHLTGRPVLDIVSVQAPDGAVLSSEDYQLSSSFKITFSQSVATKYGIGAPSFASAVPGYPAGGSGVYTGDPFDIAGRGQLREWLVTYVYGTKPNDQIRFAIWKMQEQFDLALAGDEACTLPKRITSIARQGVTMTLLDPQDFLEKGQTGIEEVDFMISVMNRGKAKARSRVFTQYNPPARRLSLVQLDESYTPPGA
jgi:hypothetical protein